MTTFSYLYLIILLFSSLFSNYQSIGMINKIEGRVTINSNQVKGTAQPNLAVGRPIYIGESIDTGIDGELQISIGDSQNLINIYSSTEIKIKGTERFNQFILNYGSVSNEIVSEIPIDLELITENSQIKLNKGECFINREFSGKDNIYALLGDIEIRSYKNGIRKSLAMGESIVSNHDSLFSPMIIDKDILPDYINKRFKVNLDLKNEIPAFTVMHLFSNDQLISGVNNKKETKKKIHLLFDTGIISVQKENYAKFLFSTNFLDDNIQIGYDATGFLGLSDTAKNLNKFSDISYLLGPFIFKYKSYKEIYKVKIGSIDNLNFGYGSLLNNYTNSIAPPDKQDAGLILDFNYSSGRYKSTIFASSISELIKGGGLIGIYSTANLNFLGPAFLGFGFVKDINQFVALDDTLWKNIDPIKRSIIGYQINLTYELKSSLRNDTYLFSEFSTLNYADDLRYIRSEVILGDTLQQGFERKSSFGLKGPGIWWKIGHHRNLKIAFNYSSALYSSPFFSETYSLERGHYILSSELDTLEKNEPYSSDKQWNAMIKSNHLTSDSMSYFLPKDIYLLLNATSNVNNKTGVSVEYSYNYRNYYNYALNFEIFKEGSVAQSPSTFYNFGIEFFVHEGLIKGISEFGLYFNQYFTSNLLNTSKYSENMTMGGNLEIGIIKNIALQIYRHDVFYDSNFDGKVNLNSTIGLGLVAKY